MKKTLPAELLQSIRNFLPKLGEVSFLKTAPSSVTTAWGVAWDETLVARDLMQNFRDANKNQMDSIATTTKGGNIMLSAPAEFNVARLFYLGSEKGEGDIGAYGEGFKASVLALLRDFKVVPFVVSGKNIVHLSVADDFIEDTSLRPIIYDFYQHDGDVSGTYMIILGCGKKLIHELEHSLEHFFWPGNPLLGEILMESKDLDIYRAKSGGNGVGFYMGLKRCTVENVPLVFNLKKNWKTLDNKIASDRDRKAFDANVSAIYYGVLAKKMDVPASKEVLRLTKPHWSDGNALLSKIANEFYLDASAAYNLFGDVIDFSKYYAAVEGYEARHDPELRLVEEKFAEDGRIKLPSYFVRFGVPNVYTEQSRSKKAEAERLKSISSWLPTPMERKAVDTLQNAIAVLNPVMHSFFANRRLVTRICQSEDILGQMRASARHQASEMLLNASMFTGPLHRALATILHEYSHIYGFDGDRRFTDSLTDVLESVIANKDKLSDIENEWEICRKLVIEERSNSEMLPLMKLLSMQKPELDALFERAPIELLKSLLDEPSAEESKPARPTEGETPFQKLKAVLDVATAGTKLFVCDNEFNEALVLYKVGTVTANEKSGEFTMNCSLQDGRSGWCKFGVKPDSAVNPDLGLSIDGIFYGIESFDFNINALRAPSDERLNQAINQLKSQLAKGAPDPGNHLVDGTIAAWLNSLNLPKKDTKALVADVMVRAELFTLIANLFRSGTMSDAEFNEILPEVETMEGRRNILARLQDEYELE